MAIIGNGITTGAAGLDNMITVSDAQPTIPSNKVWVKETSSEIVVPTAEEVEELANSLGSKVSAPVQTVSGESITFSDGADNAPLKRLTVEFELEQSGSGDPSATNIRPFRSISGLDVYHAQSDVSDIKNTLSIEFTDPESGDPYVLYSGTVTFNEDGSVDIFSAKAGKKVSDISVTPTMPDAGLFRYDGTSTIFPGYIVGSAYYPPNASATMLRGVGYKNYTATDETRGTFAISTYQVLMSDNTCSTIEEFTSKYADCMIVWDLDEEHQKNIHISDVGTLYTYLGINNIWTSENANNITAEYYASMGLYVDAALENIENEIGSSSQVSWVHENDGYYISTRFATIGVTTIDINNPYSYSNSYSTGKASFIACNPGDIFIISLMSNVSYAPYAICDSNGVIIDMGAGDYQYHNHQLVMPNNAAYIGFNSVQQDAYRVIYKNDNKFDKIGVRLDNLEHSIISPYHGLSCVAFGTSLTYRDIGYRPYLEELLGMSIDNQGVGSSFWRHWQQDSGNVLYNVQNYNGYADKDVCIIEGCVNDWGGSRALGTYSDTSTDTVCGCLYNMIAHVYTQNPNIQIIVILDHFGRLYNSVDDSSSAKNNNNLTQYEYYEEIAKTCEFYGIPCIKEYALSSIGMFGTEYLYDNIHLTALGAKQSAQTIASAMVSIKPKKLAT